MQASDVQCPSCAGTSKATGIRARTDQEYAINKCTSCGLAFALPRPTPEQLADFYGAAYFETDTAFGYGQYDGASMAALNAVSTWDTLPTWVPDLDGLAGRRLLDVGAATGHFAARAVENGWSAVACEIGDEARELAAAKGLATIKSMDETDGPFDLITMFHVIEHLIDPNETLRAARRVVAAGGRLVIEAPQWNSAGRLSRRAQWSQLKPPEHINFFTQDSVRKALRASGWQPVSVSTIYPRSGELALRSARNREVMAAARLGAQWAVGRLGFGAFLRVVASPT